MEPEKMKDISHQASNNSFTFMIVFLALAALAVGEVYTLTQVGSLRGSFKSQVAQINAKLDERLTALERSNNQILESVRQEVEKRAGSAQSELRRERALLKKHQEDESKTADQLKAELAQKADQQQVGAITQDVSATRSDLDNTKKVLDATRNDLGMARSEFGTLIARNHDEIEQLRKMGERDYYEFTLARKKPEHVANLGLVLKSTSLKRHRFSIVVQADDMDIEKKNRTVNEPIFFYVGGAKKPFELVVNSVQSDQVKGYVSTPKGAMEQATAKPEGGR